METSPVTCRTLEEFYHIDCHTFEKQYKEVLSGYRNWEQLSHADEWMLFPENIGPHLAIDETSLSNGELYTFVTNRDACTRECSLVAVVAGTKSEDVIAVLQRIDEESRYAVKEVTLDLSDSMRKIVRTAFPKACRVIDRFHIQKLACDAVQHLLPHPAPQVPRVCLGGFFRPAQHGDRQRRTGPDPGVLRPGAEYSVSAGYCADPALLSAGAAAAAAGHLSGGHPVYWSG